MKIEFQDTIYVSFAVTETKWQIINCWDLPLHCRHGTACAGIIAAVKNQNCSIGVAYDSRFAGNTLCVIFAFIFLPSIHFTFFPSLFFLLSFLYFFFNNMGIWAKHQTKHVPRFVLNNCQHWSLHTTFDIGHCIQLSSLVTAYNCRHCSLHKTVDIGHCIQLSSLVTAYNCQHWSLYTTVDIGHCIQLSTMYTIYNGACFYYRLNIPSYPRSVFDSQISFDRIWEHDVLCLLFTYCMYFT